jgi:hypothetical protein
MAQQALFDGPASERPRRAKTSAVSQPRDKKATDPLELCVAQLSTTSDALDRARLASRIRDIATELVASSIRDASRTGKTWREIGAALDVPFQTLHRRYGEKY